MLTFAVCFISKHRRDPLVEPSATHVARQEPDHSCSSGLIAEEEAMLTEDKAVGAAHCLWTVMQTHRILNEIMSRNWDAHHCVQAVLSMHVIRNRVTPVAFDGLSTKLDVLTKIIDKLDGRISTLEKKK